MYDNIPDTYWDDNKNIGWHEYRIGISVHSYDFVNRYCAIVGWLEKNIPMHYRHARWTTDEEGIKVKFRYERDYLLFVLRWS